MTFKEVKFEVYIPEAYFKSLHKELNSIGALTIGDYDHCLSTTRVTGYWRPLEGANPFDGEVGEIKKASELKIEFRSKETLVTEIIQVIKRVHPYEEPMYNIIPVINTNY